MQHAGPASNALGRSKAQVYSAFQDATKQLRLLKFTNRPGAATLSLDMTIFDMDRAPPYVAISYTWGNLDMEPILINGIKMLVRHNCRYALSQVRLHHTDSCIWIDSICINQNDDKEKNKQVAAMFSIYVQAENVVTSLGEHKGDSDWLMAFIGSLTFIYDGLTKQHNLNWKKIMSGHHDEKITDNRIWHAFLTALDVSELRRLWAAIVYFADRGYWSRLWILQELAAAESCVMLLCGPDRLSIYLYSIVANSIAEFIEQDWPAVEADVEDWTARDMTLRHSYEITTFVGISLTKLELGFWYGSMPSGLKCADTRDRLYAIMPFIDWGERGPVLPDYAKSPWEVVKSIVPYLDLTGVRDMLRAFEIGFEDLETQLAAREYRVIADDANVRPLAREQLTISDKDADRWTLCARLTSAASGYLAASLIRWDSMCSTKDEVSAWTLISNGKHGLLDAHEMIPVYADDTLAALLCAQARPDDFILPVGRVTDGLLLVIREQSPCDNLFDVVGQGILLNEYCVGTASIGISLPQSKLDQGFADNVDGQLVSFFAYS